METTHVYDESIGGMRQIVTAGRLREILQADGETLGRPSDFGPRDEWDVGDDSDED